jgi:hypothetical protein
MLDVGEFELAGQLTHAAAAVAATVDEYVPAEQSEHTADPVNSLYFPATHAEHSPLSGPVCPTLQVHTMLDVGEFELAGHVTHAAAAVAPTVDEYVPDEQSEHADDPVTSLYFPATQAEHCAPSAPVYPALHVHVVEVLDPTVDEYDLEGHCKQTVAPFVSMYFAASQSVHATLPMFPLYFPAIHSSHEPKRPVLPALHSGMIHAD